MSASEPKIVIVRCGSREEYLWMNGALLRLNDLFLLASMEPNQRFADSRSAAERLD